MEETLIPAVPDLENDLAATIASQLGPRKPVQKPDISRLPTALGVDGTPLFGVGDKIVIERYSGALDGCPYLDTRTYRVKSVDLVTGLVALYDEVLFQNAFDNWRDGVTRGQQYRFSMGGTFSTKKKRGRPRKNPVAPKEEVPQGEKRGRGRPKGAKNRAKEVIKAEKEEKKARRAAKVAKRKPKKKTVKAGK